MTENDLNVIAAIAERVSLITVLIAWLFREMKARDKLSEDILEQWRIMNIERIKKSDKE